MVQTLSKITLIIIFILQVIVAQDLVLEKNTPKVKLAPIIKSLVIPGTGEFSLGNKTRGRVFSLVESALWITTIGSFLMSNIDQRKSQVFASEHANVFVSGKDREFWVDIGNYDTREAFIQEHLRFRDNDAVERYKNPDWSYKEDIKWDWDWKGSTSQRESFESMRISSDHWALVGKFFIGGIVLNHIVSAIDVLYLQNRFLSTGKITFVPRYDPVTTNLTCSLTVQF